MEDDATRALADKVSADATALAVSTATMARDLATKNNADLNAIKEKLIEHAASDEVHFQKISNDLRIMKEMGNPTNAVLATMISGVEKNLETRLAGNDEKTVSILVQTTKTNGRVADIEKWRWLITGGLLVVTALVVPIILDFAKKALSK